MPTRGTRGDRRRRPCRHAGLHRRPHAHGRAGVLGSARHLVVLARRHHGGHGQLRLHARPGVARRSASSSSATSSGPRTSPARPWRPASTGAGTTFAEYLDAVDRLPKGINYAANDRTLGAAHVGDGRAGLRRAGVRRRPGGDAARAARRAAGRRVSGFTTSRTDQHETSDDRPVASRLASWDEVVALVGVLGELGTGVFEIAQRVQPRRRRPSSASGDRRDCATSPSSTGCRSTFGVGSAGRLDGDRSTCSTPRPPVAACSGQTHSRGISVVLSFRSRTAFDRSPDGRRVRALPPTSSAGAARPKCASSSSGRRNHGDYGRADRRRSAASPTTTACACSTIPLPPNPTVAEAAPSARRRSRSSSSSTSRSRPTCDSSSCSSSPPSTPTADRGDEAPAHGDDLLRRGRARQPDLRLLDPDPPARLLGTRARGVHARGGGAHAHARAGDAHGDFTDRGLVREGIRRRPQRLRSRHGRAGDARTVSTTCPPARRGSCRSTGFRATIVDGEAVLRDGEPTGNLSGQLLRNARHGSAWQLLVRSSAGRRAPGCGRRTRTATAGTPCTPPA